MEIILSAIQAGLALAWEHFCGSIPNVRIHRGSILDLTCDAVVSPANSFGFMNGGIDAVYVHYFGPSLQDRVRSAIQGRHQGELPVGEAAVVETDNERIPYLIVAPTMRVPMILHDSNNPYLAARAALHLVRFGAHLGRPLNQIIQSVAFPGLGTGVGQVPPETCARQMCAALQEFRKNTPPSY